MEPAHSEGAARHHDNIGKNAFKNCVKLKTIVLGKKLTTIGENAFKGCTTLEKITLETKVTTIGKSAFDGCKTLKNVNIKTKKLTADTVGKNAFRNIHADAVIKCPAKVKNVYQTFLPVE